MRPLVLLLALALGACDAAFEPGVEGGPAVALFGTLDGRQSRQALRVQVLGEPLVGPPEALPVTVTSTELASGRTTTWRDSLVTLADGGQAHVFVAELAVQPGETHRIEAVRERDGARSTAAVRLPGPTATVGGTESDATVRVDVADLSGRYTNVALRYRVRRPDGSRDTSFVAPAFLEPVGGGATFLAFLGEAERRASIALYEDGGRGAVFVEARLEAVVFSLDGVPVENGVGEVGWVVPVTVPITFPEAALEQAGFVAGSE